MHQTVSTDKPAVTSPEPTPPAWRRVLRSDGMARSWTGIAFVVIFTIFGIWLGSRFLNVNARLLDVHQDIPIILLGFSVLVTLTAGQFDLSVAAMSTLTTFLAIGLPVQHHWPFALVLLTCLGIGLLGGLVNGLIVVKLRVNAFIATLGMSGVFSGLAQVYSGGKTVVPTTETGQLPKWFNGGDSALGLFTAKAPEPVVWIVVAAAAAAALWASRAARPARMTQRTWDIVLGGSATIVVVLLFTLVNLSEWVAGISWMILVLLGLATLLWVLLRFTSYGRYLRATGSNQTAARLAGVHTDRITMAAFTLGGLLAATAGILLAAQLGTASPSVADQYLLPAFAAAFLSTVIFSRGQFTVWGTLAGGVMIVWISQGLIVGGLSSTWTDIVNGLVLVFAVGLPALLRRRP